MVRVLRPGGRLVITDMDAHPYTWLKEEMADVWQGFERDQIRAWYKEAGLVNVIVDCTGQSCCAQSANPIVSDQQGREARISVFVATGTRRIVMRQAVQDSYAAMATSNASCGCSPSASAGESSCCGDTAQTSSNTADYSLVELSAAPSEAAEFSLGCGNPIAMASLGAGEVVLDIGSGGGLDAFLAARRVGPTGHVIGVDMTPAMLERARGSAVRAGIANVEFRKGFAENLPVEDGAVDVILSNCVINLSEDKGQVFHEAFRALKPGGRLEVSDIVTAGPVPIERRYNSEGWSECITGALPEQEYLDLIVQAGFQQPSTRRSTGVESLVAEVPVYSLIVSAKKPGPDPQSRQGQTAPVRGCCG
jgi:ubiquinone/menaquinone biosynthesis C-methylase UbiE